MKLRSMISILVGLLFFCPNLVYSGEPKHPEIQVEVVPSDVLANKVDLFIVITNPNDFDVYVGTITTSSIATDYQITNSDGVISVGRDDFSLVPAKSKRIRQLHLDCELRDGFTHFKVQLSGFSDPNAKLPSNYIPFGGGQFEFDIKTEGSK